MKIRMLVTEIKKHSFDHTFMSEANRKDYCARCTIHHSLHRDTVQTIIKSSTEVDVNGDDIVSLHVEEDHSPLFKMDHKSIRIVSGLSPK